MDTLPFEVISLIADELQHPPDLVCMAGVCRSFRDGTFDSRRWRSIQQARVLLSSPAQLTPRSSGIGGVLMTKRQAPPSDARPRSNDEWLQVLGGYRGRMSSLQLAVRIDLVMYFQTSRFTEAEVTRRFFTFHPHSSLSSAHLACATGSINILRHMHTTYGEDALNLHYAFGRALRMACDRGHLEIVRYLHDHLGFTTSDARAVSNEALKFACTSGNLPLVRFMVEAFELEARDAREQHNGCLRKACREGHIDILIYLHRTFSLGYADASAYGNYALRQACSGGHVAIVEYLNQQLGLGVDDARTSHALEVACCIGSVDLIRCLHVQYGLTAADVDHTLHFKVCYKGHVDVLQYLHESFGIDEATVPELINASLFKGREEVTRYLLPLGGNHVTNESLKALVRSFRKTMEHGYKHNYKAHRCMDIIKAYRKSGSLDRPAPQT
eukprot:TRINITY_DN9456_c0_g1_i1.p1 TRINITY_DN9456_c0_g1~~TRINITY_DN9456_c0_g1_i1.p1  ORF type:complete len:442 (+),score=61.39 TRINITY_DN9456_c0_g1_i1:216-1541(+)